LYKFDNILAIQHEINSKIIRKQIPYYIQSL